MAAEMGNIEMAEFVLKIGANINAPVSANGWLTALQAAILNKRAVVIQRLLDAGADMNDCHSLENGHTALPAVIKTKPFEPVKDLIVRVASLSVDCLSANPLSIAISEGLLDVFDILIQAGLYPNGRYTDKYEVTPIQFATNAGQNPLISAVIAPGADLTGVLAPFLCAPPLYGQ